MTTSRCFKVIFASIIISDNVGVNIFMMSKYSILGKHANISPDDELSIMSYLMARSKRRRVSLVLSCLDYNNLQRTLNFLQAKIEVISMRQKVLCPPHRWLSRKRGEDNQK